MVLLPNETVELAFQCVRDSSLFTHIEFCLLTSKAYLVGVCPILPYYGLPSEPIPLKLLDPSLTVIWSYFSSQTFPMKFVRYLAILNEHY
jgi:hypothetical protein